MGFIFKAIWGFFYNPINILLKHRVLLFQTTRNDIRARFAGSVLGLIWLFLYPLLFLSAYSVIIIFVYGARFKGLSGAESVAFIFCGLIPFLGFAEALGMGVASVTSNAGLIKNTLFPIELIPVKSVFSSQCTQVAGTILLLGFLGYVGSLTPWALLLIPIWILQLMFMIGLIWIVSSLNVYLRDLQNIIAVIVLILMMVSPIGWHEKMVPESIQPAMKFNPLYYIIFAYRDVLLGIITDSEKLSPAQFPHGSIFIGLTIISFVTFFVGYWFFSRMKKVFVDNV